MRTLRLARVAAEAEGLLLRRRLRRIAIRAGLGAVAMLFLVGAATMLHVYAWVRLRPIWGPDITALALAGFDAVLAIIIALFALWTPSDRIASEAITVRDKAMVEMRSAFSITSMLKPLAGILFEQWLVRRKK
jgi:hypothetical protein